MLKAMREWVPKIAVDDFGFRLLCRVLDAVDDIKLVEKMILAPFFKKGAEMAGDRFGSRVLLHILKPASGRYLPADLVQILKTEPTRKKTPETRHTELMAAVAEPLRELLVDEAFDVAEAVEDQWAGQLIEECVSCPTISCPCVVTDAYLSLPTGARARARPSSATTPTRTPLSLPAWPPPLPRCCRATTSTTARAPSSGS